MSLLRRLFRRAPRDAGPAELVELVLYTRTGCVLCREMKQELERARSGIGQAFRIREVDIDGDPELAIRHGWSIPVLELDGRPVAKGRLAARDLARIARKVEKAGARG